MNLSKFISLTLISAAALALWLLAAPNAIAQGVGFGQTIGSFPDGVILNTTPVATADRRYVRMQMNPQFVGLQGFDTWTVPAAVSGGGGFGGGSFGGFNNNGGFGGAGFGGYGQAFGTTMYGPVYGQPAFGGQLGGMPVPPPQTYNALGPLGGAIKRSTRAGWRGP